MPNGGPGWHVKGIGDFNGDGKADILWQNDDLTPAIWEMDGTSIIGGGVLQNPGPGWHIVAPADFNGDGKTDILWQNSGDGTFATWELNGLSIIGGGLLPNPGPGWHFFGTGDFNGDGKADLFWQNDDGSSAVWEMNGGAVIGGGIIGALPAVTTVSADPTPEPAPADPPPPTADPPSTVHNVLGNGFFQGAFVAGADATANDGDTFNLLSANTSLSIIGLSGTMTFVSQNGNVVGITAPTGANSITDNGQGTHFTVNEDASPTLQHMISIFGFQNDATALLAVSDTSFGLPITIKPDGAGGSLVVNSAGHAFVDLVGDPNPSLSQLSTFRATV